MLNQFVSVYVPGTKQVNVPLTGKEKKRYTRETGRRLSVLFGGATAQKVEGYWISDGGGLVIEDITIVKSYHDKESCLALEGARAIAVWLKVALQQESVTIETNGGIEFC